MGMGKTPIEIMLDRVDWKRTDAQPNKEGLPYTTHEGILDLGGYKLRVFMLNTGERIIEKNDLENFVNQLSSQ